MSIADPSKKSKPQTHSKKCFFAKVKEVSCLNKPGSCKKNYHVVLDLKGSEISYKVGSCIGIYPDNCTSDVKDILESLRIAPAHEFYATRSEKNTDAYSYLLHVANLAKIPKPLANLVYQKTENLALKELLEDRDKWKMYTETNDVPAFLKSFLTIQIDPSEVLNTLLPMMPRFYSIASSQRAAKDEVHLMVASFFYERGGKKRQSLTTAHLKDCLEGKRDSIALFLQENHHFTLPEDHTIPVIMIGPGTGMAAFRGFIQERVSQEKGNLWLFTGDRRRAFDFHYEEELKAYEKEGYLRLSTAFSRDDVHKVYVQHKMLEAAHELWDWIDNKNGYIFVSGDAKRMAKDVSHALIEIAMQEGGLSEEEAKNYFKALRKEHRFVLDVY